MKTSLALTALVALLTAGRGAAQYPGWKHSGSVYVLTTPDGADLPAPASVEDFPLLVRLHKDFFDFAQARPDGADLRFASATGDPLAYQIEDWDAVKGVASVWVRVPKITGNARQEIKLHWGKPDAKSESSGKGVFNASNGYLSVWHMGDTVTDAVGTLESQDTGTTATPGVIGTARHFPGQKGVFGGDKIPNYPTGASPHTTEVWFRAERPNVNVVAWGNEQAQGKVVMQYRGPPHVRMDCYFSDGSVASKSALPKGEWVHVAHTYEKGNSRVYVNGVLDGATTGGAAPLNVRTPARLWIGGWYGNYDFVGDIDEVRVSKVARSAAWVKLQYENQKPLQTLVGPVVQPGAAFDVAQSQLVMKEGERVTLTAKAGGAQRVYWSLVRDGKETVVATDRFAYQLEAGRVTGDQKLTLRFKGVYANETKVKDVPVTIKEGVPEPEFTLQAPADWDGRKSIEVVPQITNRDAMTAAGADRLNVNWRVADLATVHEAAPGKLLLKRSQNSGKLVVTAAIDNGGTPTVKSVTITVTEPAKDAWVARAPAKDEKPTDGQFYARDDANEGTLHCNGTLSEPADAVLLKVFADDKPFAEASQKPKADGSYALAVKLKPGLVKYRAELVAKTGAAEAVVHKASNLVCGDAYIITGQSNAVATDFGKDDPAFRSEWIRTFGSTSGSPKGVALWGDAVHRSRDAGKFQIGYWGMELGRRLVEAHKVPVCYINGAVGGTRIDQHQRNAADPTDGTTIYGRLLWRVREAKLTHGVRGVLWHQGENDQGADGPTGGYGYETYRQFFIDLAAAWKTDFPNVRHYYVFQIWPKSCAMGINGSDNRLREVQRNLPTAFSNLSVMSTLGIDPPGGCHFPAAGYAEFARLICPLIERDHYGKAPATSITPPNLKRAHFAGDKRDEIVLEFDQPVKWDDALVGQFYLDGQKGKVASGVAAGNRVTLKLVAATDAKTVTYLDSAAWSQKALLVGANGLAALTFCEVPLAPAEKTPARAEPAKKVLPLDGVVFEASGRTAFLIPARADPHAAAKPWVWYAPTLPNLPGAEERWMFERFRAAGIAVAGIDAGESYGSPAGNKVFDALYAALTAKGYSQKPVLLGRSRGGLMTLSWATANPDKVGAFAGIYPVCDLASYPGVERAAGAFELKPAELNEKLKQFNPIDRLDGLAKAKVPLFAIHGDIDTVVPLEANSGRVKKRYAAIGGAMTLIVPPQQGHNMWPGFFRCRELVAFVVAHAGVGLSLESPQDYQVVQRNAKNVGAVRVRGTLGEAARRADVLEYRVGADGNPGPWKKLDAPVKDGVFDATAEVAAGGWYRFEVRAVAGGKAVASAGVERLGVGEVFVVAGQSNSANHGAEKQTTKTGRVAAFDGTHWQPASDPQPGASGAGGSFLPPFGDAVAEKFGVPVGLVACGVGATSVREWLPKGATFPNPPTLEGNVRKRADGSWESKGDLYAAFCARVTGLGPNGFRAVLWHQGESDANQKDATRTLPGKLYREYLERLIRDSRKNIGWDAPWFVAQVSYHVPGDEASPDIRAAQAALWKDGVALEGPDSDALKGELRENGGKGVHFSGPGLREHGAKWAEKVGPWLEQQTANKDR